MKNYPTYDLELVAVIHALKIWGHYLYGMHLDVYANPNSCIFFIQKDLNLLQRRWLELPKDYDVEIQGR